MCDKFVKNVNLPLEKGNKVGIIEEQTPKREGKSDIIEKRCQKNVDKGLQNGIISIVPWERRKKVL